MSRIGLFLAVCLLAAQASPSVRADTAQVLTRPPRTPDPATHYVFYLHGLIIEEKGRRPRHPQYGVYEYEAVLAALARRGATVISEVRKPGTRIGRYAERVVAQIEALRRAGVPDAHITVVGFSKGGTIARHISARLAAPIRYAVLASCPGPVPKGHPGQATLHGEVLSLREESDAVPSCQPLFKRSAATATTREVVVQIGGSHGAFYRPHPTWLKHVLALIHRPALHHHEAKRGPAR